MAENKTKTKTQEEELEQTFGAYATEIPEDEAFTKGSDKKEGKSKNSLVILVVGAMAVLGVIWFLILPLLSKLSVKAKPVAVSNTTTNSPNEKPIEAVQAPVVEQVQPVQVAPVQVAPINVEPVQPIQVAPVAVEQVQPVQVAPVQVGEVLNNNGGVQLNPVQVEVPNNSGNSGNVVISVPNKETNKVTELSVPVSNNNTELLEGIKSYFDGKLDVMRQTGEKHGEQISELQVNFGKMNERLSALEKNKKPVVKVENNVVRKVVKPVVPKEEVIVTGKVTTQPNVNVSEERTIVNKPVSVKDNNEEVLIVKKGVAKVNNYKIHSLFNGRVWIENADNTHSSYSVNDKLPGGEVIKLIDMEKDLIMTDKGQIKTN